MQIIALVLGVIGTISGVVSLGWQVLSFHQSGPVVRLNVTYPIIPVNTKDGNLIYTARIVAYNVGRGPIDILYWGIIPPDGDYLHGPSGRRVSEFCDRLPFRLKAGSCGIWFMPLDEIDQLCRKDDVHRNDLTAFIELADGRIIKASLPK